MNGMLVALINDVLSFAGVPGTALLTELLKKRLERAREILLSELAAGNIQPGDAAADESVAIIYRYQRAAIEGAARLNLRMLAAVFAGQVQGSAIAADEFLYYADILATLRREELVLLGTLLRLQKEVAPDAPPRDLHMRVTGVLVPGTFKTIDDYSAAAAALQRTGLVAPVLPGQNFGPAGGVIFRPTSLLFKVNALAVIEGVLARDAQQ